MLALLGVAFSPALPAPSATAAFLIGVLVGLGLAAGWLRQARPRGLDAVAAQTDRRSQSLRTALLLLRTRIDVVLLGWLVDTTSAGIFNAASLVAQLVVFPLMAIHALFHPTIATLYAEKQHDRLQELTTTTAIWSLLAGFALWLPVFVAGGQILALLGPEFGVGTPMLRIVLAAHLVASAAGSIVALITMTDNERLACKVVAGLVVIARFGLLGAAIVDAASIVAWNAAFGYAAWARLGMIPSILGVFRGMAKPRRVPID